MKIIPLAVAPFFIFFFICSAACLALPGFRCHLDLGSVNSEGKESIFLAFEGIMRDTEEGWRFDAKSDLVDKPLQSLGDLSLHVVIAPLVNSILISRSFYIKAEIDTIKKSFRMDLNIKGVDFQLLRNIFVPQLNIKAATRGEINVAGDENRIFCRGVLYLYDGNLENLYYFREAMVKFYGDYPYIEIVNSYVIVPTQGRVMLGGILNLEELSSSPDYKKNYLKFNEADSYRVKQRKIEDYHRQEYSFLSFLNKDYSLKDNFCRSYRISPHSFFIFSKKPFDSGKRIKLKADYE